MSHRPPRLILDPDASVRREAARAWLFERPATSDVLVLAETLTAARELLFPGADRARLGWRRSTLRRVASELAAPALAERGLVEGGGLARDAIVARVIADRGSEALGRLAPVADTPGFVRAIGSTLEELRLAGIAPDALSPSDPDLAALAGWVAEEWTRAGLADRASVLEAATRAMKEDGRGSRQPGRPLLLLDARVWTPREAELVAALIERAPDALITVPPADRRTLDALGGTLSSDSAASSADAAEGNAAPDARGTTSLERLRAHLFAAAPAPGGSDDTVTVFSAPGEGRECVEIARRLLELAASGTPFDRCAVLLRQPEDYRPYLEEALGRADIPAYFERGVRRPDPAGRSFLALLRCRAEAYSASRFAEYLSIGEVPDARPDGTPPEARDSGERWVAPGDEEGGEGVASPSPAEPGGRGADAAMEGGADLERPLDGPSDGPVRAGTLRVPRRWEQLLVDAAVVGGLDRWERRLAGLRAELELRRAGLLAETIDHPGVAQIERALTDLAHLSDYALPLLQDLAALPDAALWSEWLDRLGALATRALRDPHRLLGALAELAPMAPIGPVELAEVLNVLAPRLSEITEPPPKSRFGCVFVGSIDAARGLSFDAVFIPGMAERLFPPKIAEDPILLDPLRHALNGRDAGAGDLPTNEDRVAAERLGLAIAVGAARRRVALSYPRIEAVEARPRVPSFYALEAMRAAVGRLPTFEELAQRAEEVSEARIGWPAPKTAERAIDEAEYDLAVLYDLGVRGEAAVRAAGHLLQTNPHLARALRFRAYRWGVRAWTWADGLVGLSDPAAAILERHAPDARAFSATALQHFAACPYRFYLQALVGLEPREAPVGIEALDPLERGSLVHGVQFELLSKLQADSTEARPLLPVRPDNLQVANETLDATLERVASEFRDRLVPAIDRVWEDGIESIRQDLRQWLYRESLSDSPFVPWRFELSFGLPPDPSRDERSRTEPVELGVGLRLRGAIDLVERAPGDVLRVTDHKTGRLRAKRNAIIQGGELLQPVLYALAAQAMFPEARVESGRFYHCTADGGFATHEVPLDARSKEAASTLSEVLGAAFAARRFPALPRPGACAWCDYRTVCGPDEERRIRRKPDAVDLARLRDYA